MSNNGDRGSGIGDRGSEAGGRLDLAIDIAVREMLDVEAPAGLRGRVLNRIDALSTNHVASGFSRKIWWIAGPIAAAAVIVLTVLAPWRQTAWRQTAPQTGPSAAPSIAQAQPAQVPPPVTSQRSQPPQTALNPAPAVTPAVTLSGPRPSPAAIDDRVVVATVAADDNPIAGIDPLAPIDPITVAAARPRDIAPKEIAISPLASIPELQIAPLSPPDRRN